MTHYAYDATIPAELAGYRIDQALAQMFPEHSRSRLTDWLKAGSITIDGAVMKARTRVEGGERVVVDVEVQAAARVEAEPIALDVAYEDESVLVINKPVGLVVHPGAGNHNGTLQNALLHYAKTLADVPRAGLVHRIDKDTSGLLLVAKTLPAHTALVRQLAEREIARTYEAVCHGVLTGGGTIEAPIDRHPQDRLRMAVREGGREAITHYRVLARHAATTHVSIKLETGRTHQIRVHFSHQRHPLVGDALYGGRSRVPAGKNQTLRDAITAFPRQALHAAQLEFSHPDTGKTVSVSAPLPDDLRTLLAVLQDNLNVD
ncbi:MAG: 23S rRNA pseudouridine(1911/1915/1917) synthase RluD [Pseudomonadota bacterium]